MNKQQDTITLVNKDGRSIEFDVIAGIKIDSGFYLITTTNDPEVQLDEGEALVFKVIKKVLSNKESYELETDDAVLDKVFAEYDRLLDAQ